MFDLEDFCQLTQTALANVAADNYPALKRQKLGVLDAIVSQGNNNGSVLQTQVDPGNGKKKTVIVDYLQPDIIENTLTSKADICGETGTEESYQRTTFDLEDFRGTPVMKWTFPELRKLCKATDEVKVEVIASKMDAMFKAINRDIIAKLNAGAGLFVGGVAAGKNIQLLNAGPPVNINALGANNLTEDFAAAGLSGVPIVAGHGKLQQYVRLSSMACCNDYGQDLTKTQGEFDYYWDIDVKAVTGNADDFFAWNPGAVQLITYNEYKGDFRQIGPDFALTTIVDPMTGLECDMKMYFDKCDELWKMAIWLNFDVFILPDNMYREDDPREGVNHLFKYRATQA